MSWFKRCTLLKSIDDLLLFITIYSHTNLNFQYLQSSGFEDNRLLPRDFIIYPRLVKVGAAYRIRCSNMVHRVLCTMICFKRLLQKCLNNPYAIRSSNMPHRLLHTMTRFQKSKPHSSIRNLRNDCAISTPSCGRPTLAIASP